MIAQSTGLRNFSGHNVSSFHFGKAGYLIGLFTPSFFFLLIFFTFQSKSKSCTHFKGASYVNYLVMGFNNMFANSES